MENIRSQTVSGFKWVAFSRYAQKGLSVLTFIVLARLLEPRVFGLFAMAFIVIDGLGMFKNLGIDSALVQRKNDVEKASHTAFWIMPILGLFIYGILYFISPFAARIMEEPDLISVVNALGLIFILGSLENIPANLLNKELKFKELALRELISSVLFSVFAVVFALLNFGVWSLVYAYLIRRVSMFYFSWTLSDYRPKFVFDSKIAWELVHYGKFIFSSSLIGFLIMNTDNFLVGKLMGAEQLGFYALAYNLSSLTTSHLSTLVNRVMFPVYSKLQDAKDEIRIFTKKIFKALALFSFPFGLILILFSSEVIVLLYGAKWLPLVPALKVLAIGSMLLPMSGVSESVMLALGKSNWTFYLKIPIVIGMGVLIPMLSWKWGLFGVGLAVMISKLCVLPKFLQLMDKLIGFSFKEVLAALQNVMIASGVMVVTGILGKHFLNDIIGDYSVILYGSISTASYVGTIYLIDKSVFSDFKQFFMSKGKDKITKSLKVEEVSG